MESPARPPQSLVCKSPFRLVICGSLPHSKSWHLSRLAPVTSDLRGQAQCRKSPSVHGYMFTCNARDASSVILSLTWRCEDACMACSTLIVAQACGVPASAGGATLIFETELLGINGDVAEA